MKTFKHKSILAAMAIAAAMLVSQWASAAVIPLTISETPGAASFQETAQTPLVFYSNNNGTLFSPTGIPTTGSVSTVGLPSNHVQNSRETITATVLVGQIRDIVGDVFNVALDVLQTGSTAQLLYGFSVAIAGGNSYVYTGAPLSEVANNLGSGFSDYVFAPPINLAGLPGNTVVTFTWDQTWNDGHDEAFLVRAGTPPAIPIPAALWLIGSALLGISGISRRKALSI